MRPTSLLLTLVFAAALASCGGASESECLDVPALPAANATAVAEFVSCRGYIDWTAESAPQPTVAPHGEETRVYINASLEGSLRDASTEHLVGAASVKEIYSGGTLSGWAAMIKVEAGAGDTGWYWYEVLDIAPGSAPVAASVGASACIGCHQDGTDYFRTAYPLR